MKVEVAEPVPVDDADEEPLLVAVEVEVAEPVLVDDADEEPLLVAVEVEVAEPVLVDVPDEDDDDEEEAVLDAVLVEDDVAVDVVEGAQAIAATGVSRLVVVPSPSCPWALLPQQ